MPFVPVDNPKCPKCGKSVYAAEEKVAGGYKYHKSCFKCGKLIFFCKFGTNLGCFCILKEPSGSRDPIYAMKSKTININSSLTETCNKMLDSTNCTEHDKELFCKNCHGRKFGPKGYGFGGGAG